MFFYSLSECDDFEWNFRSHHAPVLSIPDIIQLTKAAAGKSGQERENELYSLLKTWIFLGGAVEYGMNANKKIS